jgi:hypothetical protein
MECKHRLCHKLSVSCLHYFLLLKMDSKARVQTQLNSILFYTEFIFFEIKASTL